MHDESEKTMYVKPELNSNDDIGVKMKHIINALKEKGYKPTQQIAGYIISGDPIYITSYKGARKEILTVEREDIIEYLLNFYIKEY